MTQSAIAAKIHQSLDVHRHFATQIAFDLIIMIDVFADTQNFRLGKLIYSLRRFNSYACANLQRIGWTNAIDITQRYMQRFSRWNIYTCNTGHAALLKFMCFSASAGTKPTPNTKNLNAPIGKPPENPVFAASVVIRFQSQCKKTYSSGCKRPQAQSIELRWRSIGNDTPLSSIRNDIFRAILLKKHGFWSKRPKN